ncbi:MAG TPA: hypothetical protein DCZ37_04090 [Alteromonas macleodii]|nr:hypothetical protein [Alteromonas macleodii]
MIVNINCARARVFKVFVYFVQRRLRANTFHFVIV